MARKARLATLPREANSVRVKSSSHLDPLWPALARHVARRSTIQDRDLLIDLARHPENREVPFQWGLRFIVRGDLLLDDGEFLTLDELADQAGIERLPYLDEMEPELKVHWRTDEIDEDDQEEDEQAEPEPPIPPQ
jgi:hypothetical protein